MTSFCPFCKAILVNSNTHCPDNKTYPCQECKNCHCYFYTKDNYTKLKNLAIKNKTKLNSNVYYFADSIYKKETFVSNTKNKLKSKKVRKSQKTKVRDFIPRSNKSANIDVDIIKKPNLTSAILKEASKCYYYKNKLCLYIDDKCEPLSLKCRNDFAKHNREEQKQQNNVYRIEQPKQTEISGIIVTGIVLSDNRKCTISNHNLKDIIAKINIVTQNGKIYLISLPAAYCNDCDVYFVLKRDFQKAKEQGVLLCSVEDKTLKYIQKHANQKYKTIGESRIHKMGYNVRKDVGYTDMQRHVILANILENTNIARHEILSVIDAGIARHQSKTTHQHAILCWISDREFVTNYKTGDMPEVLIDKMVLKYHSE